MLSIAAASGLGMRLVQRDGDRSLFLPGRTTHGHFQIELACNECHEDAFSDAAVLQNACERCHATDLKISEDSHPASRFRDPRNANRVAVLDARLCVTCHREHKPEVTHAMGLSLPEDYCYRCHQDIAEERSSHQGLGFDTCASAGCHNFHDNRALYEDYLVGHADEPDNLPQATVPLLPRAKPGPPSKGAPPPDKQLGADETRLFIESAHGVAGIDCSKCHDSGDRWIDRPVADSCQGCHDKQVDGWKRGRHGMRVNSGLSPMATNSARLPMKANASHSELGCGSCHQSHGFNTRFAAAEACQSCHDDEHTRSYPTSAHARLWQAELKGTAPPGSGVSCATCHLHRVGDEGGVYVEHNQNDTLRPNEKMIRPVCGKCHGLAFAIDALADAQLIKRNFNGRPKAHVASIDWAAARVNH